MRKLRGNGLIASKRVIAYSVGGLTNELVKTRTYLDFCGGNSEHRCVS